MSGLGLPPFDRLSHSKEGQPYNSEAELCSDYFAWLDFLLETALSLQETGVFLPGVAVQKNELASALGASMLQRGSGEASPETAKALRRGQEYLLTRAFAGLNAGAQLPLIKLFTTYQMNGLERLGFLMALAPLENRKYAACYARLQGSAAQTVPSDLLVRSLYGLYGSEKSGEALKLCDSGSLLRRTLFLPDREGALHLRRRVWLWLSGSRELDRETAHFCKWLAPTDEPILVNEEQYALLRSHAERGAPALIQLCGRGGSGRSFFLRRLSADLSRAILSIDLDEACACTDAERELLLDRIALECRLTDCLPHLHGGAGNSEGEARRIIARVAEISPLLFLSTEKPRNLSEQGLPPCVVLLLDELTLAQRRTLWENISCRLPMSEGLDLKLCATQYRLTPGAIERACREALELARGRGREKVTAEELQSCVYRGSTGRLEELATRVRPVFAWEDLMLPEEQKAVLALARDRLRLREQVDETWGFGAKFAYGRGLSMMLCGPPGTGKTMAAQVLAREIGLELFRVDMSRLTSKYIGESEKNISRIFDAARDSNAILLFDEADSLFAKRTEVQNSNDRYANAEVSFLLQKMEEYEGMCILSTNLAKNFDMAFFRRITFVVRFQMPDAEQRLELWQGAFPAHAPLSKRLDLKHFADTVELSGSSIKSMAYNAACLAAAEGAEIGREHIIEALKLENAKTGKLFLPDG
ncbi:MAG: ATP-binding protein, partial [Oscillospiraceae bacterium]